MENLWIALLILGTWQLNLLLLVKIKVLRFIQKIDSTNFKFYAKQPGLFSRHGIFNEINSLVQTFNHLVRDWDYSFVLNKKETKDYKYGCAFVYDVHFKKEK